MAQLVGGSEPRLASGSADKTVRLWDVATGLEIRRLDGHTHGVRGVAWSPGGTPLASAAEAGTVRSGRSFPAAAWRSSPRCPRGGPPSPPEGRYKLGDILAGGF